jgi:hypothetical protein
VRALPDVFSEVLSEILVDVFSDLAALAGFFAPGDVEVDADAEAPHAPGPAIATARSAATVELPRLVNDMRREIVSAFRLGAKNPEWFRTRG